ncbi:MAG TPA: hypothetical protein ENK52_06110, partial [Saprospiraceae bacterium]|nr:hypothetical protein [Saprospiraceae bacterium]
MTVDSKTESYFFNQNQQIMVLKNTPMKRKNFTLQNFLSAFLMIMLVGFSYSAKAQCDITSGNLIGSTLAPDGTTVDLTDVDLDLSNTVPGGGIAYINAFFLSNTANINGSDFGPPATSCQYYFIYNSSGTLIGAPFAGIIPLASYPAGGTEISFDCSDLDGSVTEAKGEIYFIKLNSVNVDPNAGLPGSVTGSSYAAIRINSIEDNHAPAIEAPVDVTIDCADAFDPEGIWDIALIGYPDPTHPAPYDVTPLYPALPTLTVPLGFDPWFAGAEDNCSIKSITYNDAYLFNDPTVCYKIERTWTAEDVFGNKSTDVQYISIIDTQFPSFTTSTNTDLDQCEFQNEYDMLMEACDTPVAFNPPVSDNCSVSPQVTLVDEFRYEEYDLVF